MINRVIFGDKDKTKDNDKNFVEPELKENSQSNCDFHRKNNRNNSYEMGEDCLSLKDKIGRLSSDPKEDLCFRSALKYLIRRGDSILASEIYDEIIKNGISKENKALLNKYYKMALGITEKHMTLSGINYKLYSIIEAMSFILSEDTISEDVIMNNILRGEHILSVEGQIKTFTTKQLIDKMETIIKNGGEVNPIIKRKCRFLVNGKSYISLSRFYEMLND